MHRSREKRQILIQYVQTLLRQEAVISVPESEKIFGFLFPNLFGSQETRRLETGFGFKASKQIHQSGTPQNRITQYGNSSNATGGLDGLYRSQRCVPSYSNSSRFPALFTVQSRYKLHLQFQCLPFGILTAPRTFTKVLVAILAPLWEKGIHILHYLDNLLILSQHKEMLQTHLQEVVDTLTRYGSLINYPKSQFVPAQKVIYLGAFFNTLNPANHSQGGESGGEQDTISSK